MKKREELFVTRLCLYSKCRRLFRAIPHNKFYCSEECRKMDRKSASRRDVVCCRVCGRKIRRRDGQRWICDNPECIEKWRGNKGGGDEFGTRSLPATRKCLRCGRAFSPTYSGNWFCKECRDINRKMASQHLFPEDWGAKQHTGKN